MREIAANFGALPRLRRGFWCIPLVIVAVGAILCARAWNGERELQQLLAQRTFGDAMPSVVHRNQSRDRPYRSSAQELLLERQASWPRVLSILEATKRPGVVVRSVEANAVGSSVSVQIVTLDHQTLVKFLDDLNGDADGASALTFTLVEARSVPPSEQVEAVLAIISKQPAPTVDAAAGYAELVVRKP